jgi:hypothetical protein
MWTQIRDLLDDCAINFDYANCVAAIFGFDLGPMHSAYFEEVQVFRTSFAEEDYPPSNALPFLVERISELKRASEAQREFWQKKSPVPVLCNEVELRRIAHHVKEEGNVELLKQEFDDRFDLSLLDPFWQNVPYYTRVFLGGGIRVSSPEWDMFFAMCHFHDCAVQSDRELSRLRVKLASGNNDECEKQRLSALFSLEVRQAVICSCLFVEAFINSLAFSYRSTPPHPLTLEDDRDLREVKIDKKTGKEMQGYVRLEEKLSRWVRLMSPRKESFDKGAYPFQAFVEIQKYRDSIVHLSESKVNAYRRIDLALVIQAVDVAIEVVRATCCFLAKDLGTVAFPKWLAQRQANGLFSLSPRIKLDSITPSK